MSFSRFSLCLLLVTAVFFVGLHLLHSYYAFYAGYFVLQSIVLAVAWNILGGYIGYVNFGVSAFFAIGAYVSVALIKALGAPLPLAVLAAGIIAGLVGCGLAYLTLRLRGIFFAIVTLAIAVVAQTLVTNWDYVGGARGTYSIAPRKIPILDSYIEYIFLLMLMLVILVITVARAIERSRMGDGLTALRDDEIAAEAVGVPTLQMKIIVTGLSGAFMGMAGAPYPYYVTFLEPASAFNLSITVNAIAMAMIGGTASWIGPLIGAILLGTVQQIVTVTAAAEVSLLIVGLMLVGFVTLAPKGLIGLTLRRVKA